MMMKLSFRPKIKLFCSAFVKDMGMDLIVDDPIDILGEVVLDHDSEMADDEIMLSIYDDRYKDKDGEDASMHISINKEAAVHIQKYLEAFLQLTV